ncbi:MAG: cytidylate kinase-like family protein [Ruminococcaceae bacterium]|nr:cytidylate kinase-like family protein [Oscillospiraceae bacterium]
MNRIITIGREFGSGGREVGKRIAEGLGIAYYDKEILSEIAKRTELAESYVRQVVERRPIVYYPITTGHTFYTNADPTAQYTNSILTEQNNVIRDLASNSDCVIVGRCADYILRDLKPLRLFIYSDMEHKIKRCREKAEVDEHMSDRAMRRYIKRIDRGRASYYQHYTGRVWGDRLNYDLCINTASNSIKEIVSSVIAIYQ